MFSPLQIADNYQISYSFKCIHKADYLAMYVAMLIHISITGERRQCHSQKGSSNIHSKINTQFINFFTVQTISLIILLPLCAVSSAQGGNGHNSFMESL